MTALTVGVEEEFLVLTSDGRLSEQGDLLADGPAPPHGDTQRELVRCQVEVSTGVCADATSASRQLAELRARLAAKAAARGLRLLATGTPPLVQPASPPITPDARYRRVAAHFAELAYTSNTCGCHVHVGIPDRATGVAVSNRLRSWLPVLLALTANSRYDDGIDTGYQSWRYVLWSRWPAAGPPPIFDSVDHYDHTVDVLLRTGALLDRRNVYWDIRLSEQHPTLEIRVADVCATVEEAGLLAALVRGLATVALRDVAGTGAADMGTAAPPHEILRAALWRAARDGLAAQVPHPVTGLVTDMWPQVRDLIALVEPVLDEDRDLVSNTIALLMAHGNGADRQAAAFARRGEFADVLDSFAVAAPNPSAL